MMHTRHGRERGVVLVAVLFCVIVLAGHGRHGTLGCARLLVDSRYEERLYPEKAEWPKMLAVQVQHLRPPSPKKEELGGGTRDQVDIVAEA